MRQKGKKAAGFLLAMLLLVGGMPFQTQAAAAADDRLKGELRAYDTYGVFRDYQRVSDGAVASGGKPESGLNGTAFVVKLNDSGDVVWTKDYSGSGLPSISYVRQTSRGSYLFAGSKEGQFFYGELDHNGREMWSESKFSGTAEAKGIRETRDGGFLIVGQLINSGNRDVAFVRSTAAGASEPVQIIEKPGEQYIYDVLPTDDGGFVLAGKTDSDSGAPKSNNYLIKLNEDGSVAWEKNYYKKKAGATGAEYESNTLQGIAYNQDKTGFVATGNVLPANITGQFLQLMSTDLQGNERWIQVYPEAGARLGTDVIPTADGGYLALGGNNGGAGALLKASVEGELQWEWDVPSSGNLFAGVQLADGSYRLAGGWNSGMLYELRVGEPEKVAFDDNKNILTGATEAMEYSVDRGKTYVSYDPDHEPTFPGTVEVWVRYKQDWAKGYETGDPKKVQFTANDYIKTVGVLQDISARYGTEISHLGLPAKASISLASGSSAEAAVAWDSGTPAYEPTRPGTYTFTGALTPPEGILNPDHLTASVKVIVGAEPLPDVTIAKVQPLSVIRAVYGTPVTALNLPTTVTVELSDGQPAKVEVVWDGGTPSYNGKAPGTYTFRGTLMPPAGVTNPADLSAAVQVIVAAKEPDLTGIAAEPSAMRLQVGQSQQTVITAVYSDGQRLALPVSASLRFSSDDTSIAEVQPDGWVTGRVPGKAVITAEYLGHQANIEVEVWKKADDGPTPSPSPSPSGGSGSSSVVTPAPASPAMNRVTVTCSGSSCSASLGDELKLDLPLTEGEGPFNITIEKITLPQGTVPSTMTLLSPVFELLKNNAGAVFMQPVTLKIKFDPDRIGSDQRAGLFYYDESGKTWLEVKGRSEGGYYIAGVDHFTKFAVFGVTKEAVTPPQPAIDPQPVRSFGDTTGHWAEAFIAEATVKGIVEGDADGKFRPDDAVTRAQFIAMLMRALGTVEPEPITDGFGYSDDADIAKWAQPYVNAAVRQKIARGYEDHTFRPNATVTRAEMAVMIARALDLTTEGIAFAAFTDADTIPAWAKTAAAAAEQLGIVEGRGNRAFAPFEPATRAEAVVVLLRMLEAR